MNKNDMPNRIKRIEFWTGSTVQDFCVKHGFYTCGTNEQYEEMLDFVTENDDPTNENLFIVARDILEHSDEEVRDNYVVSDIMMMLSHGAVCLDYFVD